MSYFTGAPQSGLNVRQGRDTAAVLVSSRQAGKRAKRPLVHLAIGYTTSLSWLRRWPGDMWQPLISAMVMLRRVETIRARTR